MLYFDRWAQVCYLAAGVRIKPDTAPAPLMPRAFCRQPRIMHMTDAENTEDVAISPAARTFVVTAIGASLAAFNLGFDLGASLYSCCRSWPCRSPATS